MPSQTIENYLKALFKLAGENGQATLSELSRELGVSSPTVNSMMKKLQQKGWVEYQKYRPIHLTGKGREAAAHIIRKHRITEMFLVEKMGFGWEEVHDIAEEMEHIHSDVLFERMDRMLGYPAVDPHGSPIPDKYGKLAHFSYRKLSDLEAGSKVRLCALSSSSNDLLVLLNERNIRLGTAMEVISIESFDRSYTLRCNDTTVVLSDEVCRNLLVEPAD